MVFINIFDVDSQNSEVPLLILQSGEHILGRGSFSNCTDKRISRNHAVINIEDNQATLKSVHVNPCYYMSQSQPKVQILTKNLPVVLGDGDKFAFLSDIWYRIKIVMDATHTPLINGTRTPSIPLLNKDSADTVITSPSCSRIYDGTSPIKRSLEELNNEGRKKLKTINESLDQLLENINEITQDNKSSVESKKEGDDGLDNMTKQLFRKKDISDSDDDSDVDMVPEVTRDTEIVTNVDSSKPEEKEKVSSDSDDDDVKSDAECGSSLVEDPVKKEPTEVAKAKVEPVESSVKEGDPDLNSDGASGGATEAPSTADREDNKEDSKPEQGDASSSTSATSIGNKLKREQCWYGGSCYRKNASHRDELSHPGDDDYSPDPNDDRPECSYGASCYRSNQLHRRQYRHPSSRPAPHPSGGRKRGRATPQTYNDSDTGDEDDEAFSADESSSENYDVGDSDSDFSGSEHFDGEENTEEMKIMFKEAKKFLRRNRKD